MFRRLNAQDGFTLVEMVVALVIAAILTAVLMRSAAHVSDAASFKQTEAEMDALTVAIAGNPSVENNGVRADFGYVGDVGALPTSLDNLVTNPGGYSTWKGPYINNRFTQVADDYKTDAWGSVYTYLSDSARITSTGSGSSLSRQFAVSKNSLLINRFYGTVRDLDGSAPGATYKDSVTVRLTVPNGAGATVTRTTSLDMGGSFVFDSLPIGNHTLKVIYKPTSDTLTRTISILPGRNEFAEYTFSADYWRAAGSGGLTLIPGSDTLTTGCSRLRFYIRNVTGKSIAISSIRLWYPGTTAYWRRILWNATVVFNTGTGLASGDSAVFSSTQTIADGQRVKLEFRRFRSNTGSGSAVDMSNVAFTIRFTDGSVLRLTGDHCI